LRIGRSGLTRGDREWPLNEETHTRPCLTCCPRLQCERDWGCVSSSATRIASSVAARRWRVSLHRHLPLSPLTSHLSPLSLLPHGVPSLHGGGVSLFIVTSLSHLSPLSLLPHGVPSLHGGGVSLFIVTSLSHLSPLASLSPPPRSSVAARRWRVSLHRHLPLSPLTSLSSPPRQEALAVALPVRRGGSKQAVQAGEEGVRELVASTAAAHALAAAVRRARPQQPQQPGHLVTHVRAHPPSERETHLERETTSALAAAVRRARPQQPQQPGHLVTHVRAHPPSRRTSQRCVQPQHSWGCWRYGRHWDTSFATHLTRLPPPGVARVTVGVLTRPAGCAEARTVLEMPPAASSRLSSLSPPHDYAGAAGGWVTAPHRRAPPPPHRRLPPRLRQLLPSAAPSLHCRVLRPLLAHAHACHCRLLRSHPLHCRLLRDPPQGPPRGQSGRQCLA
jgi:hypothetical protein